MRAAACSASVSSLAGRFDFGRAALSFNQTSRVAMTKPLFAVGQSVSVAYSKHYRHAEGAYRVIGAMPNSGGARQYRIKGDLEKFERIVDEIHLAAA
jgi:hypothetical protein